MLISIAGLTVSGYRPLSILWNPIVSQKGNYPALLRKFLYVVVEEMQVFIYWDGENIEEKIFKEIPKLPRNIDIQRICLSLILIAALERK